MSGGKERRGSARLHRWVPGQVSNEDVGVYEGFERSTTS